jgi:hypothetical protein
MNGAIRPTYINGNYLVDAGVLNIDHVWGLDLPSANVTAPAVPASTVTVTNPYPYSVMVYISGGTYTAVSVNGGATLGTPNDVLLPANATIAITYSVAPTWVWVSGV